MSDARARLHVSLRPTTNALLLLVWLGVAAGIVGLVGASVLWLMGVGAAVGAAAGARQRASLRDDAAAYRAAGSALQVRAVMAQSTWGRRYLTLLWFAQLGFLALAIVVARTAGRHHAEATALQTAVAVALGYASLYASFAAAREAVTLPATLRLTAR